jgi:hypothetical protein
MDDNHPDRSGFTPPSSRKRKKGVHDGRFKRPAAAGLTALAGVAARSQY